jgi:hypothetical protein
VRILLSISVLLALTACGVLSHGTSQELSCVTAPEGALVRSANGATCSTPCTVSLKRKHDDVLTIEKEGYETVALPVRSAISRASVGSILLPGGLIYWGVDLVSGGGYHLVPERVAITLKPLTERGSLATATTTKLSVSKSLTPNLEEELN